jgi:hypothetical protein
MRQATCESHRRGLRSDAHYDLQVACLDRREAGFAQLVGLLAQGDADAVTNANQAIAALPSPEACMDTEALLAEQPPADDPWVEAEVCELRMELARAEVEESAGLYEPAEARAAAVLRRADELAYAPLRAEALLRWGNAGLQARRGEASDRLDRALWLSLVTEQPRVAAEAAAKRIYTRVEIDFGSVSVHDLGRGPSTMMAERAEQALLLEALGRLPVELQATLELHYWESMTMDEIGATLGCRPAPSRRGCAAPEPCCASSSTAYAHPSNPAFTFHVPRCVPMYARTAPPYPVASAVNANVHVPLLS